MGIGNLGWAEILVIAVFVLIFFGPQRLPEIARSMGSAMREFRRSLNQIQRELEDADPRTHIKRSIYGEDSRRPAGWQQTSEKPAPVPPPTADAERVSAEPATEADDDAGEPPAS
jgi:sec-independent protein translocase protein TatA